MNQASQPDDLVVEHEIKIQSMIKSLTNQRDSALNTAVNIQSEKAVVEHRLKQALEANEKLAEKYARLETVAAQKIQSENELRVVIANLQAQLPPPKVEPEELQPEPASKDEGKLPDPLHVTAVEESRSLLQRVGDLASPLLGKSS